MNVHLLTDFCFLISTGFFLIALRIILPAFFIKTVAHKSHLTTVVEKGYQEL